MNGRKVVVDNGAVWKEMHVDRVNSRENFATYSALAMPSSVFSASSTYIDYEISSSKLAHIDQLAIQFDVSNTNIQAQASNAQWNNAGDILPIKLSYIVERIETYIGSQLAETIYSEQIDAMNLLFNDVSRHCTLADQMNYNKPNMAGNKVPYNLASNKQQIYGSKTYSSVYDRVSANLLDVVSPVGSNNTLTYTDNMGLFAIPSGSTLWSTTNAPNTARWFLPIRNWITQSHVFIPALRERIRVRVYIRGGSAIYVPTATFPVTTTGGVAGTDNLATTGLHLDNTQLVARGISYPDNVVSRMMARYARAPHKSRCYVHRQQNSTLSAGLSLTSDISVPLTGHSGTYADLAFIVRASGAQQQYFQAYAGIDYYTMLDSAGSPDGFPQIRSSYNLGMVVPFQCPAPASAEGSVLNSLYNLSITSSSTDAENWQALPVYCHMFSHKLLEAWETGASLGTQFLNGLWSLQLRGQTAQKGGSKTATSYDVITMGLQETLVTIDPSGGLTLEFK